MELKDSKEYCPHCNKDLQGDAIPLENRHLYGATHFSNKIGIYDLEKDMEVKYLCPFCNGEWDR